MTTDKITQSAAVAVIVNDDKIQLHALSALLRKDGIEVHSFESVTAALEYMNRNDPPNILVTDLYMPGIDGWRFCRLLRSPEYGAFNSIPILVVSATFAGEEATRIAADLGANAFMSAPVNAQIFREQVLRLLRGEQPQLFSRVLIVDDDDILAHVLKTTFDAYGYKTDISLTGRDAETKFAAEPYDIVILDHHLPDMVGIELLLSLTKYHSDTVFLAITADLKPELALEWMKQGAAAFLNKPFHPSYLIELGRKARRERELLRVEDRLESRTRELRESEEIFRSISDNAFDLMSMLDGIGCFLYCNKAYQDILGYAPAELTGRRFYEIVHPADRQKAIQILQDRMAQDQSSETSDNVLLGILCKDGSVKWVLHHIKLIEGLPGPYKMIINARDVTEQRLAEEALRVQVDSLRESELFLSQGEKIARMGGWKANPITNQLLWTEGVNHLVEVATDYRPGLEEGLKFYKPDYLPVLNKLLIEAFNAGTPFNLETELVTATGKLLWTEVRGLGKIEDGSGIWVVGTIQDITERKRDEEEKKKLQLELAQAQKMESVGRLAGGIAHDFNNMLQAILTNTGLVIEELPPDSPLRDNLEEVMQCSRRSADLTRQLLAFARKQTIAPKVLDLNDTVKGMIKMLRRLIGEDIQLGWLPGPELWRVKMDPGQIDQILANLCVNARDAINNVGKVIIETKNVTVDKTYIAGHPDALPGDYVLLTVSDNGCGMDRDVLDHLFEPFYTTKRIGKGTGLGLATVYGIVDQNHGFINVYSEPNHGTTLKVYLPRYLGKSEKNHIEPPKQAINRGHETILLVEDSLSILQSGKQLLESLGYNVLAANTPNEAIRLAIEHADNIHLLITDVIMPEMNGRDLSLKIFQYSPKIKCLYMSGYTANVIAHHGILDEGLNFIQKPFTNEVMAQKIRDLLDKKVNIDC